MSEEDPYFVPTRSSRVNKCHSHEIVMQLTKPKEISSDSEKKARSNPSSGKPEELSMKDVRFEVYKFAQSALSSTDKQKSKVELAIKLGAKPPKKQYVNYKQLKENKIKELEDAKRKNELYNVPIQNRISEYKSKLNKGALRRKRKIGSGILNVYGKVTKNKINQK